MNMTGRKRSIAIDMDGVIADTIANFLIWHERASGSRYDRSVFEGRPEADGLPGNAVKNYVTSTGFFRSAPVIPGSQEALRTLSNDFDVYIVSAAMEFPQSLPEKKEWLSEHFPFIGWRNIVFCGDKSIIHTDFMIDDHLKNLDSFSGKPILFSAEHNFGIDKYDRVDNWSQAVELLYKL